MFAEIILNKTAKELNKVFDYVIPDILKQELKLGDRVIVPFGAKDKEVDGIVTNIKDTSKFANKEIIKIEDSYLTDGDIKFAKLMARRYFCNEFECIKLMLPPGTVSKDRDNWVKEKKSNFVYLAKSKKEILNDIEDNKITSKKHQEVLKYLIEEKEAIQLNTLIQILDVSRGIIKTIEKNGYIEIREEVLTRNPCNSKNIERSSSYILNDEQMYAYSRINDCIGKEIFQEFLLYGVTGSR